MKKKEMINTIKEEVKRQWEILECYERVFGEDSQEYENQSNRWLEAQHIAWLLGIKY